MGCAWKDINHKVDYYNSGDFNQSCKHCKARLLPGEMKRYAKARNTKCCLNGRAWTEAVQRDYERLQNPPKLFKDLCDVEKSGDEAKLFMKYAKQLNAFFAFARSWATTKEWRDVE
jgi:hypothetical protein